MIKETFGHLLHPSIPACDANTAVCDVASGTGLWLVELAKEYPSSSMHGVDIDISQAPPKEWLPPNVTFGTLDMFKPIPEDLVGKFEYEQHSRLKQWTD